MAEVRPGAWRRLRVGEQGDVSSFKFVASWRIDLPKHLHKHPFVDHLLVGIDSVFPSSDPVVIAAQAVGSGKPVWPHVETRGNLCLCKLSYSAAVGKRVLTTLEDALEVLSMEEQQREAELRREMLSYWAHRTTAGSCQSIVESRAGSRDIVWGRTKHGSILFAEDEASLNQWLAREGGEPPKVASTTRLVWLEHPLVPDEYPNIGEDVLVLAGRETIAPHLRPGHGLPVLIGCEVGGETIFVAADLEGFSAKHAQKGFRRSHPRPPALVVDGFRMRNVHKRRVLRSDATTVHGRARNPQFKRIRESKVAIVGCGALGGFIARGLAQAGVGSLVLVDDDDLSPSNVGRHVLGMEWVTKKKAAALAFQIKREFPHMVDVADIPARFEGLNAGQLQQLAQCQLVVLAGIDLVGELRFDDWRLSIDPRPALVWTWVEAFAVAGHAVGILDNVSIAGGLDADRQFKMRLTAEWPERIEFVPEAGCGVSYQPFATIDMMSAVNVASRLALDILLGRAEHNEVRSWLGDRAAAASQGCRIATEFDRSFAEISRPLRW